MIDKILLKSNQSIMDNVPKPTIVINSTLSVISPVHAIKNTFIICLDVAIIRANNAENNLMNIKYNCASDGNGLKT